MERTAAYEGIEEQRRRTVTRIAWLTREFDAIVESAETSNVDDEHDPEGQTIGFERAEVSALLAEATARLADIDRAAARLDDGGYGRCGKCGRPITLERLHAAPTATTCIGCAAATERTRRRAAARRR